MTKRLIHTTAGPVQMVPVEATETMRAAHWKVDPFGHDLAGRDWAAMLAAAPASPQADVVALIEALDAIVADLPAVSHYSLLENARAALSRFKVEEDDA